jgi:hypothetical protein
MAITYKWTINALDAKISHDSKDNVINTIHWGYSASEEHEAGMYTASSIGTHSVEYDADNFTEYDSLAKADVIGWLENALDVDAMKASLDAQIALQKVPVDKTFHSPFAESVEE